MHEAIEEEIFYPALKEHPKTKDIALEGYEEHHVVDMVMGELEGVDVSDETWMAKFTVMKENLEHHIEEEEDEMFPKAEQVFTDGELGELGRPHAGSEGRAEGTAGLRLPTSLVSDYWSASGHAGGSTPSCSNRTLVGSRSSRHRTNVAACRKRPYCMRSIVTSATSTGSIATHSRSRPPVHRLGPAGRATELEARPLELPQLREHRAALGRLERRRVPHVVQRAGVVVEAEQQGADAVAGLRQPVAADHHVERAPVLHLHPAALPRQVRLVLALGEHTVLAEAVLVVEPDLGLGRCRRSRARRARRAPEASRAGRRAPRPIRARRRARCSRVAPLGQRQAREVVAPLAEQVEEHEGRRDLAGELAHPRLRGMQPQLQLVELHRAVGDAHDLAVGHERPFPAEPSSASISSGK